GADFVRLMTRDLGFQPNQLLVFEVNLPEARYALEKGIDFVSSLTERLQHTPGITAIGGSTPLPITGESMSVGFDFPDHPLPPRQRPRSNMAIILPGTFHTLGAAMREGREFDDHDDDRAPLVVIVNQAFADRFFAGQTVIGKRITPGALSP